MSDIVERLREQAELVPVVPRAPWKAMAEAADEITSLRAQVAALEVDAGRYRYLRSSDWQCFDHEWLREMDMPSDTGLSYVVHEKALDAAIDAALAARKGG